jgi:Family of unknown function (DUF6220)
MDMARKTYLVLAWLFVLAVVIQFLLAGLGVFGGESIEAHRWWGFLALHLIPILMVVAAIIGRMGRGVIGFTVLVFLLVFLQPLFVDPGLEPRWLRSFHVLNAAFILILGLHIAQRATRTVRGMAATSRGD